jgi:hypothetical protein
MGNRKPASAGFLLPAFTLCIGSVREDIHDQDQFQRGFGNSQKQNTMWERQQLQPPRHA